MLRTFDALDLLFNLARERKAKVFAFATAAVRNAKNAEFFISKFNSKYGESLDVLSGENEGKMGVLGALKGKSGCIIDVGGASSEVVCSCCGKIVYAHSMQVGAVSLTDIPLNCDDVFIIGNEGHGIPTDISSLCNGSVYIPISQDAESLNASVAASVIMWEQSKK